MTAHNLTSSKTIENGKIEGNDQNHTLEPMYIHPLREAICSKSDIYLRIHEQTTVQELNEIERLDPQLR